MKDYQNLTKEFVMSHLKAEKDVGKEIYPAFAGLKLMSEEGRETDGSKLDKCCNDLNYANHLLLVCKSLECGNAAAGVLAW
jgi:hypothetical protein